MALHFPISTGSDTPLGFCCEAAAFLRAFAVGGACCLTLLLGPNLHAQGSLDEPAQQAQLAERIESLDRELNQTVRGWLEEHCTACHEGEEAEANLDLTKPFTVNTVVRSAEKWRQLWQRVEAGEMPPPDEAVLTPEQK